MSKERRKKIVSYTIDKEIIDKVNEEADSKKSKYSKSRSGVVNGRLKESYRK